MYILPKPQKMSATDEVFYLSYDDEIVIDDTCQTEAYTYACLLQADILEHTGFELDIRRGKKTRGGIWLVRDAKCGAQEYGLTVDEDGIVIRASSKEGMLYGVQTLRQIVLQQGAAVSHMTIEDYPEMEYRGLYYDVTRCRIPTLDYLKRLVDKLSYYKINQLQLYIEHTYMFQNLSEVWRDDTPLTAQDILELDAYCALRNVELVPSIATFGHLYKVLRTKSYRHLCEMEELCDQPFGFVDRMEHHTIDISNEESFEFVRSLIDEYMPLFRSDKFNICGDETMDLGKGKGKPLADEIGEEGMYIRHVKRLCEYLVQKGKTPMFWGDIICRFPEAVRQLPPQTICLNWGYDADVDDTNTEKLADVGARIYNCPGVSGWNQFVNRIGASYENIRRMCAYGHQYHVQGILNTDWGDFGHINHPDMGFVGMIYGACFSWNSKTPSFDEINKEISVVEYHDKCGGFVALIADISELWAYQWSNLTGYREQKEAAWSESRLADMDCSEKNLLEKKKQLLAYIAKLDGSRKDIMRPYVIAVDGMILLQETGKAFAVKEGNRQLAEAWEKWFYRYKKEWRRTSRESELYRVQELIFWTADRLRSL